MRSTPFSRQALSADEERLVALGIAMKVGACALVCAVLTLIAVTAIEHAAVDEAANPQANHPAAATFASSYGLAASMRRQVYEERRARFDAARADVRAINTAEVERR